jgi:tetratricopeptide (TPR) repeat protein
VIFVVLAAVAALQFLNQQPRQLPAKSEVKDVDSPPRPRGNVLWLQANQAKYPYCYKGMIARELFRQAVLIAARDGLGLQTRDASLREWHGEPASQNGLGMDFEGEGVVLHDIQSPGYPRWRHSYDANSWPSDLDSIVESNEKMSRGDFVGVLRKAGWSGNGNSASAEAPAPADAEARLMEMEELSQFAVLRETYTAIRTDGESLQRLGALVRAYANLGQLTRYHWSEEYAALAARSLLYAQRMVENNPNSAVALWHRAYARAMAGLQQGAMDDLTAAGQLQPPNPPTWVRLLEPYCKYQTGTLVKLATSDQKISSLGMFLAFLTVEHSGSQAAIMDVAQAALTMNPRCLRIVDTMCDHSGPGMLNELSETGPRIFSQTLGSALQKLPSFPKRLSDQIEGFRRPEGNPAGRETICQELIEIGAPDRDATEPSWSALGRLIQETTFAHVERKARLISEQWCVDASDYVNEVQPLIAEHPFKFVVDVYGLRHSPNVDPQTVKRRLSEPTSVLMESTYRQMPVYFLEMQIQSGGPDTSRDYWGWISANADFNSFDIEDLANIAKGQENTPWDTNELDHLRRVSPDSPVLVAAEIRGQWDAAKAVKWEADHGDYPSVASALGLKYAELHRWSDAERCLRKYIAVAPDMEGYENLANIYKSQHMDQKWLATLNEFISSGQAFGLEVAQVQFQIADYYMDRRDYKSALPYADAAAGTASEWGLLCAADAHTGVGDWTTAEQLIVDAMNHYSRSPYNWYSWCNRTGHGDLAGAAKAMLDYFSNKGRNLGIDELLQLGCVQMNEKKNAEALATFQRRLKQTPGPRSALYIAIIDDELHDAAARDAMLDQVQSMPERGAPLGRLAAVLRDAVKAGPNAAPDAGAIQAIYKNAEDADRVAICGLTSQYLDDRGQAAQATAYLKQSVAVKGDYIDRLLVDSKLRERGLNPWALEQAAQVPDASH